MEQPSVTTFKTGTLEQNTKFWLFFIWSIEFVEKTGFGQLTTRLSNDTDKPL